MKDHFKTYEHYSGEDLRIADRIQHLRLLMLVHSRIYYVLNNNLISDKEFDAFAKELAVLQKEHPDISEKVDWADAFADWDGSTGAFLPLDDPWVVEKTNLVYLGEKRKVKVETKTEKSKELSKTLEPVTKDMPENHQMSLDDFLELC